MKCLALFSALLYVSLTTSCAQSTKITKHRFIHVIKRAERLAKKEFGYNCAWLTKDTDSSFVKADTIYFYSFDGKKNLALQGVCRTVAWLFFDTHSLHKRENLFCQEPPVFLTSNDGRYDYHLLISTIHHKVILSTINWLSKNKEYYEVVQLKECFPADYNGAYYRMTLVRTLIHY